MPDDLYERDILVWSESQAALLRRAALGERVNGIDWPHVIEEIADLGQSEMNSVRSLLRQAMLHLLELHLWPDDPAAIHWAMETDAFLGDAALRFSPSMRQRIEPSDIYSRASRLLRRKTEARAGHPAIPTVCPWTLDQLLDGDPDALLAVLAEATGSETTG